MVSTNLVNDGNTSTNIIEATLSGSSGSNVAIKNDGTMIMAEYVASTLTNLLQVIPGTGVKAGNTGRPVEILGNLLVDGNLSINSITASSTLAVTSVSATPNIVVGTLGLTIGSLTRISTGSATVPSSQTIVVTHNLGAIPDIVLLTCTTFNNVFAAYIATSFTSTQFTLNQFSNNNVAGMVYLWLAIKF